MPYTVAALDRALDLLEILADKPDRGVTDLAQQTNSTKSQVFRLLYTLEQRGFVHKDQSTRLYSLGYRTLYIGDKTKRQMNLIRLAQPYLDELAELSRENTHLVIRKGNRSVCVAIGESPQPLRLYAQVGRRGPLHAGSASKVLLAFAPDEIVEQVLAEDLQIFTKATITDPKQLKRLLKEIRGKESYESCDDLDEGAFSIAAPIFNHDNQVVAALSIAGPVSRLSGEARAYHHSLVRDYTEKLSTILGGEKLASILD